MKKLLALLFVCAGLTAMAAPHVNKADLSQANKGQMVMKANTLGNQLIAGLSKNGNEVLTPRKMMKDLNVNFNDNRLAFKAPRRLSDEDITSLDYIDFRYVYTMTDTGVVSDPYHYRGGQGVYTQVYQGQLYLAGFYWNMITNSTYYLPLNIDYDTHEVMFEVGTLLDDDTLSGRLNPNQYPETYTDTVVWSYIADFDFVFGDAEEFTPITGTIYDDGSIEFNDSVPYVFAGYYVYNKFLRSGNPRTGYTYSMTSTDTTFFNEIYVGTQFIVANGNHEYGYKGSSTTEKKYNASVYMYQPKDDDTTVVVFNPWGFGMPGCVFNIHEDGSMFFPGQYVYNSDEGEYFANADFELTADDGFIFDSQGYVDGFIGYGNPGTVTPDAMTWHSTVLMTEDGSLFYPFLNNVITWTNDGQFVIPGPDFIKGDVDDDGNVNISDVTALIDALLSEDFDSINADAADCDEDGSISISDVTALIDYLLAGHW